MVWLIHLLGGCPGSWKQHRCLQICSWTMGLLTAVWFCQTYHQRANSFVYSKGISLPPTLKLGSRNIGNCARVRTLDRLFPFWEGEKKTSEICESNACSSWLRPQTESDWLKPPESHAKVSARIKTQTIRSMKTFTKRPAASSYASVKKRFRGKQPPKSPPIYWG